MKNNYSSGFKKILSNTGYLFGEKVFNMALSLLVGIWVARYLGPDELGLLRYAQSFVGLFIAVASLGTTQIVIRDLVNEPEESEGRILGTSFFLMLVAGVITALLVIGIGVWQNNDTLTISLIVIASVNLIFQAFDVFDYWFQSKVLSKYSVYARTIAQITISIIKVILILFSLSIIYFALTMIAAGIIQSVVWAAYFQKQKKSTMNWKFDAEYAKSLLKNAWPLIISGISVAIYMKIDQVMLKSMVNANAVGNYSVAVTVSQLWYFIPLTITSSVFPSIIQSKKDNVEKYYRRLQYLYDVMTAIAVAIALPMTFLSNFVILSLFGPEYTQAGVVLAIHIWAGVFVFLGVVRNRWIINENYQFYGMIFTISGAVANIAMNIWLIPIYGITGAAWATLVSQALSAWFIALFFDKTRLAFKMHLRAIFNALLIYPVIKSLTKILKEASD